MTDETCIIVVEITHGSRKFSTGIVVDRVQEVLDIPGSDIEDAPQFGASVNTDFILGMGKVGESVKILLDINRVLVGGELVHYTHDQSEDAARGRREHIGIPVKGQHDEISATVVRDGGRSP